MTGSKSSTHKNMTRPFCAVLDRTKCEWGVRRRGGAREERRGEGGGRRASLDSRQVEHHGHKVLLGVHKQISIN